MKKDAENKSEDSKDKDAVLPELNVSWQPFQGAAIVYDVDKDEIIIEERPSLS